MPLKLDEDAGDLNAGVHPYVHAIGLVALQWNASELAVDEIIWSYLGVDVPSGRLVTRPMGAMTKADLLRRLVELKEPDAQIKGHIDHAIKCWNICRENRNHVVHGIAQSLGEDDKLQLTKHRSSKPIEDNIFEFDVESIRNLADQIFQCGAYIASLAVIISTVLVQRENDASLEEEAVELGLAQIAMNTPPTLPQKPPQPDKLNPLLLADRDNGQAPSQSS